MLRTLKYFLNRAYTLLSIGLFIFTYTALKVGAIYYPTDNITNPSCAPGDSGCYVSLLPDQTSNSGSLLFTNGTNPSWTSNSALTWDSVNGRLGVGTSSPSQKLQIGDGTGNNFLSVVNSATTIYLGQSGNTRFGYAGGTIGLLLQSATDVAMGIGTYRGDAPLVFGTNNIERMRIAGTTGNIGIGTTTPLSKLHISSSPTASANYGTFSLGSGAFDGTTSGYFGTSSSSNSNGTSLAINEASGYTGDLINAQIAGVSLLKSTVNSLQVQGSGSATVAQFTRTDSGEARLTVMAKLTSGIPAVQLVQNSFNGVDYTPIPTGQQIGRIFARGPKNSGGTYSSIMGAGIVFNATENWNDSATGSKTAFSVTKTGTTSIYYPFVINNSSLDNIYIEGMDNTSSTNALSIYNSSLSSILKARNDGKIIIGTAPVYETDTPLLLNVSGGATFIRPDGPASLIVGRTISGGLPTNSATLGSYGSASYNGTIWQSSGNRFAFFAAENWTNSTQGTWMRYYSIPVGQTASNIVFEITPSGQVNFGVGTNYPTLTETSRLFTRGMGSTSSTYTAQFHNSTGTNNALVIRDDGNIGVGTSTPNQQLEITKNFRMPSTTFAAQYGVIYKDGNRFIHDFNYGNNGTVTTDGNNTFLGLNAGNFTMGSTATLVHQGSYNTAVGNSALNANTIGFENTAVGDRTLLVNTTGQENVAIGGYVLYSNISGHNNTAVGTYSMLLNTTGLSNTSLGGNAFRKNTSGSFNVAIGANTLFENTTGSNNVALGNDAGRFQANGSTGLNTATNSVYIGYNARGFDNNDNNSIVIGAGAIGIGTNSVVLGNNSITKTALMGNVGIGTTSPTAKLTVVGGAIMPAIGNSTSAGILFPTDPGGGSGDEAYIRYYVKSVEDTRLIIGNNNDAADDIQINTQSLLVSYLNSCGGIQTNANGAMSCTSDERLKDMQGDFTKGLESIRNINPKAFSWKQDSNMYDGGVVYNGFIAQNIQSALPEAITLSSDGIHLQVSQLTLLAASINAIKELDIKVNNQSSLDTTIQGTFGYLAKEFFGNINNTIDTIFAKKVKTEELCIKDTCVTEDQLKALLNNVNSVQTQQPEQPEPNILENEPVIEETEQEIPVSDPQIVPEEII